MTIPLAPAAPPRHGVPAEGASGIERRDEAGGLHAFGHALDDAKRMSNRSAHAAAEDENPKDKDPPAREEPVPDAMQAFIDSLQTPVTATAVVIPGMPASASASIHGVNDASAEATPGTTGLNAAQPGGRGIDGLASVSGDMLGAHASPTKAQTPGTESEATLRGGDPNDLGEARASSAAPLRDRMSMASTTQVTSHEQRANPSVPEHAVSAAHGNGTAEWSKEWTPAFGAVASATAAEAPSSAGIAKAGPAQATHVAPALHAPQWQDAFSQQVLWIAKNEHQLASLTMNPPELGPVRVTLSIADGQASASFISLQPEVRQAIQDAVPRLKEMFADAGLQLQQASVGSGDAGGDPRQAAGQLPAPFESKRASAQATDASDEMSASAADPGLRGTRGTSSRLVDLFA